MSQAQPLFQPAGQPAGAPDIHQSIARAAQETGVDFDYLLAQAKLESSLDPNARANTSSAAGLFQFINSTWLETLDRHGANHGLGWADAAISAGSGKARITDPALRAQIMALRYDPDVASLMAGELARDNRAALSERLGREPDHVELYIAHFMGRDGAIRFLDELGKDSGSIAAQLFPQQAAANRAIFYAPSGESRTLGGVMNELRLRFGRALGDSLPMTAPDATGTAGDASSAYAPYGPALRQAGPLQREFRETAAGRASAPRISMAETLRDAFGGREGRETAMPAAVRAAYDRLGAFKL